MDTRAGILNGGLEPGDDADSGSWVERAQHWINGESGGSARCARRLGIRETLILAGHGMHLRINHGALEIRNGFTHYPHVQGKWRFFRGDQRRPSRIVIIEGSGAITFDVLGWLSEQDIPLIRLDWHGNAVTSLGLGNNAADPQISEIQRSIATNPPRRLALATWLIHEKLVRSSAVLRTAVRPSPERDAALARLSTDARVLSRKPPTSQDLLLGIEGRSAQAYFRSWHEMPLAWRGLARHPIPPDWHCIGPRNSARQSGRNRATGHPFHAMLNYAYAVLATQVRIELIALGFDLNISLLHASRPGRPALALDLLEPCRTIADRAILEFVREQTFSPADFTLNAEGVCRLHPQLARRVVRLVDAGPEITSLVAQVVRRFEAEAS